MLASSHALTLAPSGRARCALLLPAAPSARGPYTPSLRSHAALASGARLHGIISRQWAPAGSRAAAAVRARPERDDDLVTRVFGKVFGHAALEEEKPMVWAERCDDLEPSIPFSMLHRIWKSCSALHLPPVPRFRRRLR